VENGGLAITGYTGDAMIITIPATINDATVVAIGAWAFSKKQLTSVTIPRAATLGKGAFDDRVRIIREITEGW
jgi:hypothetical protein